MAYIIKGDLEILIYPEIIETITRANATLVDKAIATGIAEAKSYLMRFNLLKLFGNDDTDPEVVDDNLKSKVIDLVCWQLIKLANPNVDLKLFRTNYEDALEFFKNVMKGQQSPDGWPYREDDPDTTMVEGAMVNSISNPKKKHHW